MASRSAGTKLRAREQSTKVGHEVRLARIGLALSRQQVSDLAGVSWSTALRVELGDPNVGVQTLCAVCSAVGLDLVLAAYPGRQPLLRDTGQLELVERLVAQVHSAWRPQVEVAIGQHGQAIDLGLFGPDEIIDVEVERMATDFQAQLRRNDAKRQTLAAQHRRPVRLVLVVEDTARNRAALGEHGASIRTTLPAGSREVLASLRTGQLLGKDGLLWLRRRHYGGPSR